MFFKKRNQIKTKNFGFKDFVSLKSFLRKRKKKRKTKQTSSKDVCLNL